jgi:hypothetical protein
MLRAKMMIGSTSVSERCSKIITKIVKRVAVALLTATLLISISGLAQASGRRAEVRGLPDWLEPVAERSLAAVVQSVPRESSEEAVESVVRKVSERLFTGYNVDSVEVTGVLTAVNLSPAAPVLNWDLEFKIPRLGLPSLRWFEWDLEKVREPIIALIEGLPVDALSWCDVALKDAIVDILTPVLPGWEPSLVVSSSEKEMIMTVSFSPQLPLVIAVMPTLSSNTLPTMLNTELKEDLLENFSPFIGLPVSWASLHAEDLNAWIGSYLSGKSIVKQTISKTKVNFTASQVSHLDVRVESSKYTISAWAAVYAGTSDRSAEAGLHLGRKVQILPKWDMELYGELIVGLQNWSTEFRGGLRWSPWGDVWVGGEWSSKDEMWWAKLSIDPRLRKPYAWFRIREDGEINAAAGWKATEYISFELHYDSRDSGAWSLRMLGNM